MDAKAGSVLNMFNFQRGPRDEDLFWSATTGEPVGGGR